MKNILSYTLIQEPTSSFLTLSSLKEWGRISHNLWDATLNYYITASAEKAFRATGYPVGNYILQSAYQSFSGSAAEYKIANFPIAGVEVISGSTTITGWSLDIREGQSFLAFSGNQGVEKFSAKFTCSVDENRETTIKRADDIISHVRSFGVSATQLYPNLFAKYGQVDYAF